MKRRRVEFSIHSRNKIPVLGESVANYYIFAQLILHGLEANDWSLAIF